MLSAIKVGGNVTTGIIFLLEKVFWKIMFKSCSSITGIAYKLNNRKIVSFQDMGALPFTVYFNFETTIGDSVTDNKKNYQLLSNVRLPVLTWS